MVFSTNQARQFYVMEGNLKTDAAPSAAKEVLVVVTNPNAPYIVVKGAAGVTRSDLLTNIECIKVTDAAALAQKLKSTKVELVGNPIIGQDYTLTIEFLQFGGMSDEEKYFKYGMVRPTTAVASDFYKEMALSLVKNFSREISNLVSFLLLTASDSVNVTKNTKASDLTGTYTALLINEVEQEWTLGIKPLVPVYFTVTTGIVKNANSVEVIWGNVSDNTSTYNQVVGNGKVIADMEYFYMGERGDMYRLIGWPHNIHTDYLVNPTNTYDVLDVHYSFIGAGEGVQKSEKDLVVVTPHSNAAQLATLANTLAKAAGFSNYKKVGSTGAVSDIEVV